MRRGGGMAAIAAREPAARRLVTIIARARAAGVTIIADDMIEEKLRQSSCPDKFADVVESEMAKRIEAARTGTKRSIREAAARARARRKARRRECVVTV